ncbi:hypothetical protein KLEB273_gp262 [Bacillus phage vB_BauM_KLEB27-3]|nr:hypothetical protein KLEB273_gp262 [Bacillus phage vB_BauM_KLEB27-3]
MDLSYVNKEVSVIYNGFKMNLVIDDFLHFEDGLYYVTGREDMRDDISNDRFTTYQIGYDNPLCSGEPLIIERQKHPHVDKHVIVDIKGELVELHIDDYPNKYGKSFTVEAVCHEEFDSCIYTDHYLLTFDNPECNGGPINIKFNLTSY